MTPAQYHGLIFSIYLTGALISPHKNSARTPFLFAMAITQYALLLINITSK